MFIRKAVISLEFFANSLFKFKCSRCGSIFCNAVINSLDCRSLNVVACIEIRFACADAYIERVIHELGPDYSIRVVTGDYLLQISAVTAGGD